MIWDVNLAISRSTLTTVLADPGFLLAPRCATMLSTTTASPLIYGRPPQGSRAPISIARRGSCDTRSSPEPTSVPRGRPDDSIGRAGKELSQGVGGRLSCCQPDNQLKLDTTTVLREAGTDAAQDDSTRIMSCWCSHAPSPSDPRCKVRQSWKRWIPGILLLADQ